MNYETVKALNVVDVFTSTIYAMVFFLILLSPLIVYFREWNFSKFGMKVILTEVISSAIILQFVFLLIFTFISIFLENFSFGNTFTPSFGLNLFFGNGNALIDVYWNEYIQSFANDYTSFKATDRDSYGFIFLMNFYIGIGYKVFVLFFMIISVVFFFSKYNKDVSESHDYWSSGYSILLNVLLFLLVTYLHSKIASMYVLYFTQLSSDALVLNFFDYVQAVNRDIFYK